MITDERLRRMEDDWRNLNARADDIIKELRKREAGIGHDLESRIEELHDRREHLRSHIAEVRAAGSSDATEVQREMDQAARDLRNALEALDRRRAAAPPQGR